MAFGEKMFARCGEDGTKISRLGGEPINTYTIFACPNIPSGIYQVVERTFKKDRSVYMAFVDLEEAYDNVNRQQLWEVLEYGVERRLL